MLPLRRILLHAFPLCVLAAGAAGAAPPEPVRSLLDDRFIERLREIAAHDAVTMMLRAQNTRHAELSRAEIDELDQAWRAQREQREQPLVARVMNSPLSRYLLQVQAGSLGLYPEIFIMDNRGLNAGQSAITSDYWQGDEPKFQKTFEVGAGALFTSERVLHEATGTWRSQVNFTLVDPEDPSRRLGAATFEINLTELARRQRAGF